MDVDTLIPVDEYLNTSYHPDVEYVDGVVVERNVGDDLHSLVQRNLAVAFTVKYADVLALPELRSKTGETRYRIPDVCALLPPPRTNELLDAAFLPIAILSEDDPMSLMIERLDEFEKKGLPNIRVIDPRLRTMSIYSEGALQEIRGDVIATGNPRLELTRAEIFKQVDPE
jgi:Uma2 family endonuclease